MNYIREREQFISLSGQYADIAAGPRPDTSKVKNIKEKERILGEWADSWNQAYWQAQNRFCEDAGLQKPLPPEWHDIQVDYFKTNKRTHY